MSTARKQVRLSSEELHEVKQLMGALLAMLSFWSLASLELGSSLILYLGGLAAAAAFFFPKWVSRIPAVVWRWAGPVILLVIGADFILHMPEFIAPLVRMVVLLIMYRMLAPRNQREDLQVILLCLFCVIISGVLTVSLLFAFQILMFAPLAMALLFIITLLDRGKDARPRVLNWESFKWSRLLGRVWRVLDIRILVLCSAMFVMVVAVSSLLFILTPRFDFNQSIPFLEISTKARSGFSEEVKLGDVSEIQEDNSGALRIDMPSIESIAATPYWRMLVLDKYHDGRFSVSQSLRGKPLREFENLLEIRSATLPFSQRSGALWTFYMEGGISRYLPLPGDFAALRFPKFQDVETIPDTHVLGIDSVGQNVFSYQVEDLQFNQRFEVGVEEAKILNLLPLKVLSMERLGYPLTTMELSLSDSSIETLREINRSLVGEVELSAASYSQAATEYLRQRFSYSLSPDGDRSGAQDPVVSWLESGSRGHCELFAGAFILLAREAGYPTRMVVGYAGGSWNSVENFFVVRNRDAHAWVEIYDAEDRSWLRVDPTPGRGSSDPEVLLQSSMIFESGWSAWVDSLRIQWYRRIVNFEQEDQIELAMTLKDLVTEYYAAFKEKLSGWGIAIKTWVAQPINVNNMRPVALLVVFAGVLYFTWRLRYLLLGILYRVLRRPKALDPVRRQAGRYLKRIQAKSPQSKSPQSKSIRPEVVAELQALRFGPEQSARAAKPVFVKAKRTLKGLKKINPQTDPKAQ